MLQLGCRTFKADIYGVVAEFGGYVSETEENVGVIASSGTVQDFGPRSRNKRILFIKKAKFDGSAFLFYSDYLK